MPACQRMSRTVRAGLAIHAADDQYAALTYWLRDRPDEPTEFELQGTFHAPLAPVNGAMTYGLGEIRIDQQGTSTSWGVSVLPISRNLSGLKLLITPAPDGVWAYEAAGGFTW